MRVAAVNRPSLNGRPSGDACPVQFAPVTAGSTAGTGRQSPRLGPKDKPEVCTPRRDAARIEWLGTRPRLLVAFRLPLSPHPTLTAYEGWNIFTWSPSCCRRPRISTRLFHPQASPSKMGGKRPSLKAWRQIGPKSTRHSCPPAGMT